MPVLRMHNRYKIVTDGKPNKNVPTIIIPAFSRDVFLYHEPAFMTNISFATYFYNHKTSAVNFKKYMNAADYR
jgi:hypothetical protein